MSKRFTIIVTLAGVLLSFLNCNKPILTAATVMRAINVYPGSQPQNMYLNGSLMMPAPITYGDSTYHGYTVQPGTYNFRISPADSPTNYSTNDNIDFGSGKNYNFFLANFNGALVPEVEEVALNALGVDTSEIRFFDFSPNSPVLDIAFNIQQYASPYLNMYYYDTTYTIYTGRYYNDQEINSAYKTFIPLASGVYNFKLRYNDTTLAMDSMQLTLAPNQSYTIYTRGYSGDSLPSLPKFAIDTIIH